MAKLRLNEEELSRVLSAHSSFQLVREGRFDFGLIENMSPFNLKPCGVGCVMQIALNTPLPFLAALKNNDLACWFDLNYDAYWSADTFLQKLIKKGFVK